MNIIIKHDTAIKDFLNNSMAKAMLKGVLSEDALRLIEHLIKSKFSKNEPATNKSLSGIIEVEESVMSGKIKPEINNALRIFEITPPIQLYFRTNKHNIDNCFKGAGCSNIGAHFACSRNNNSHTSGVFIPVDQLKEALSHVLDKMEKERTRQEIKSYAEYNDTKQPLAQLQKSMSELGNTSVYGEGILANLFVEPSLTVTLPRESGKSDIITGPAIKILNDFVSSPQEDWGCRNEPVLLFGEFGSGKSSLLKMFAVSMVQDETKPMPIYIPLSEILIYSTSCLTDAIHKYLKSKYNIHNFGEFISDLPLCWLFDGFDELNLYNEQDTWVVARYRELEQFAQKKNSKVIISSRPIMFLGNLDNIPKNTPRIDISLFSDDKIDEWITLWKKISKYRNSNLSLDGLKSRELIDVARNPMILFMIATIFDNEMKVERPYLRSEVYKFFIDSTEKGKYIKDKDIKYKSKTLPNYRRFLQEIAFLIFRYGSSGLISQVDLQKRLPETGIVTKMISDRKIRSILIGHFFQETISNDNKKYVEFTHQSLREYLVIEKFIKMLTLSTEKKFHAHEWHELCCKMLTPAKLGFLCECLCLLKGSVRRKIFETMKRFIIDPGGIEKEFVPFDSNDKKDIEIIRTLNFTSTIRKILSYYICSVIAAYASDEFRKSLNFSAEKSFISRLFHTCHAYSPDSTIAKAWDLLINEIPGGVWGPHYSWHGFELNSSFIHDIAILSPMTKSFAINGKANYVFFDLKKRTVINLSDAMLDRCIFHNALIALEFPSVYFHRCTFVNCNIVLLDEDDKTHFEKCIFVNTNMNNLSIDDTPPENGPKITEYTKRASEILIEYAQNTECSCMVPWGDIVIDKIPDFEQIVFGIEDNEQSMLRFSNVCRTLAIVSENN